jgi:hypothetical protein
MECYYPIMQSPVKERRKTSYTGLLEGAIRILIKLSSSTDPNTRALANQALQDLLKMRRDMPTRRQFDTKR